MTRIGEEKRKVDGVVEYLAGDLSGLNVRYSVEMTV
jgi:hypothetical protein